MRIGVFGINQVLKVEELNLSCKSCNATSFFFVVAHFLLKMGELETHQKKAQH